MGLKTATNSKHTKPHIHFLNLTTKKEFNKK